MTRSHVAVIPGHRLWSRAGGVTYRNLGVEHSVDPLADWWGRVHAFLDGEHMAQR